MSAKVLILGSGGREHALCWHLKKHLGVEAAPGSDGISEIVNCWPFKDFDELSSQVKARKIDLVIVGPEKYLAEGVADALNAKGIYCFGPTQKAALLESDKAWAKAFCLRHNIPQARTETVKNNEELETKISLFQPPYVVKASGLAAGKGVWIGDNRSEAIEFGKAALGSHSSIVLEEFLVGEELSYFALVDGENYLVLGSAQDHKRLLENDRGPNTGGMGAFSPVPILTPELEEKIISKILKPSVEGLVKDRIPYRGFIFLGMMIQKGEPYLLEYNCRMGDPETQSVMLRLKTPLTDLIQSLRDKKPLRAQLDSRVSLNVVIAAKGYPDHPESGFALKGIQNPPNDVLVFHSGTKRVDGEFMASGGRLFSVNTIQKTLLECQQLIYPWIESFGFQDKVTYRRDIAVRAYRHLLNQ